MSTMSVATIDDPEFINLQPLDINPLMSKCEIKVLYTGENRNGSYITKEVATDMAKTLRGAPIVGWYSDEASDFRDHGDRITIDGNGVKFEELTKPYGFVSPDASVWFQNFEEVDEFGNKQIREYLMTTGYLWTGQYEEAKLAVDGSGRPQSMELDEPTLDGHWAENSKNGLRFFIINDAIFSKLCILGEDVEPCFEGAKVSAPEISSTFTVDSDFKHTLYSMMQQLDFALKGGQQKMPEDEEKKEEPVIENFSKNQVNNDESTINANQNIVEAEEEEKTNFTVTSEEQQQQYAALEQQYTELQSKFDALQTEYQTLVDFKNQIEDEKKDALIQSFYMLSDEDKKDVIANKAKYSLDEIEARLSVICVRKKVNFNLDEDTNSNVASEYPKVTTYTLDDNQDNGVPAWVSALRDTKNSRK